jgi:acylphosphatase
MIKRLVIEGLVQGVGYRVSLANKAKTLGIEGWVRNRRDGSVEACVVGKEEAIEALIIWSRGGPPSARVLNVHISDSTESAPLTGQFNVLPTV